MSRFEHKLGCLLHFYLFQTLGHPLKTGVEHYINSCFNMFNPSFQFSFLIFLFFIVAEHMVPCNQLQIICKLLNLLPDHY